MSDLGGMENEAKKFAGEHPDVADKGIEEAGQFAEQKTGGQHDSQIEQGEQKAEQFLGTDQQGGQGQQGDQGQQGGQGQ
jgi:hypothetical protein